MYQRRSAVRADLRTARSQSNAFPLTSHCCQCYFRLRLSVDGQSQNPRHLFTRNIREFTKSLSALCNIIRILKLLTEELHLAWLSLVRIFTSPVWSGLIQLGVILPVVKHGILGSNLGPSQIYIETPTPCFWGRPTQPYPFEPITANGNGPPSHWSWAAYRK